MSRVHIVTDSNCHIPDALCQEYHIHVVPCVLMWDGETYADGVDIRPQEFYARLRASRTIPTTAGPIPASFRAIFERLTTDGQSILAILVGSGFSSTLRLAEQAKDMLPHASITLIDSHSNAMALGFQVLAAARAATEGKPLDEVISVTQRAAGATGILFTLHDLDYLYRGGRIGALRRFLGSMLGVRPIAEIRAGSIEPIERVRTYHEAESRLLELTEERVAGRRPLRLAVVHANAEDRARTLLAAAEERFRPEESIIHDINPVLGTHVGPGALGLCYCAGI